MSKDKIKINMRSYTIPSHLDAYCNNEDFRHVQICEQSECPYHIEFNNGNECKRHDDYLRITNNGKKDSMILSMHPKHAKMIYDGTKTVELRSKWPIKYDRKIYIYETSPTQAITGSFYVDEVMYGQRPLIFDRIFRASGMPLNDFLDVFLVYFSYGAVAYAIYIRNVEWFPVPIPLSTIKKEWPEFKPPQSYRFATWRQMGLVKAEAEAERQYESAALTTKYYTLGS
ncbi:MAG: hypothetical protein HQK97_04530 [Nitrospirae bacterium]|nr:hypothetical protein [Nitrospirota bacterium]